MSTTVPREKVVTIVDNFIELQELHKRQQVTQATLIRWCVQELRSDPSTHRTRGVESYSERRKIVRENRENKEKALLYLDWLATKLEDQGGLT